MQESYQYYAFISYNKNDVDEARALHIFLEDYNIPKKFRTGQHKGKSFGKIFFAPENYSYADDLTEELKERLRGSQYLIVICSPESVKSKYVGLEVSYFYSLERKNNILLYIVGGVPQQDAADNCYHKVLWDIGLGSKLAADITTKNYTANWFRRFFQGLVDDRRSAQLNIVASLLGVKDRAELLSAHQRRTSRRNIVLMALATIFIASLIGWWFNKAVDISIDLNNNEAKECNLPPLQEGLLTLHLSNDVITKEIIPENMSASFSNIPKKLLGQDARITFEANGFCFMDKLITLQRNILLPVQRDSLLYGRVRFLLRDSGMSKVEGCRISIEGVETVSDADGMVDIYIPLKNQKTEYIIDSDRPLKNNRILVPCTGSEVIFVE